MPVPSITVSTLMTRPNAFITARLREAVAEGARALDVISHGAPVCRLALAEEMPDEWRATSRRRSAGTSQAGPDLVSGLRREGRALYLSERSGPALALWPVGKSYARSPELGLPEEVDEMRREVDQAAGPGRALGELDRHHLEAGGRRPSPSNHERWPGRTMDPRTARRTSSAFPRAGPACRKAASFVWQRQLVIEGCWRNVS